MKRLSEESPHFLNVFSLRSSANSHVSNWITQLSEETSEGKVGRQWYITENSLIKLTIVVNKYLNIY